MGNCCANCRRLPADDPCQFQNVEVLKPVQFKPNDNDKEEDTERDRERAVVLGECPARPMENGQYLDHGVWQTFVPTPREGVLKTIDHMERRKKMGKAKDEQPKPNSKEKNEQPKPNSKEKNEQPKPKSKEKQDKK